MILRAFCLCPNTPHKVPTTPKAVAGFLAMTYPDDLSAQFLPALPRDRSPCRPRQLFNSASSLGRTAAEEEQDDRQAQHPAGSGGLSRPRPRSPPLVSRGPLINLAADEPGTLSRDGSEDYSDEEERC